MPRLCACCVLAVCLLCACCVQSQAVVLSVMLQQPLSLAAALLQCKYNGGMELMRFIEVQ